MIIVTLARKPLSESSVASNVLKHGAGALNIDGCRVTTTENLNGGAYSESGRQKLPRDSRSGAAAGMCVEGGGRLPGQYIQPPGRWPANVILQHLDGCQRVGTAKIRPANGSGRAGAGSRGFQSEYVLGESRGVGFTGGLVGTDGRETVEAWVCNPDCPVPDVDEQSGVSHSSGGRIGNKDGGLIYGGGKGLAGAHMAGDPGFGDVGGASRYFKQVGGDRGEP